MTFTSMSANEAWKKVLGKKDAHWDRVASRFDADFIDLSLDPPFRIDENSRIFCIGSCFARNIEEHLIYRDLDVLSKQVVSPKSEWPYRANGFLNKFTTHSMAQELQWLQTPDIDISAMIVGTEKNWYDLQLAPNMPPVLKERAIERRRYVTEQYFSRIREANIVILTLGLNEAWRDETTGFWLNAAPSYYDSQRQPERFSFHVTNVAENLEQLEIVNDIVTSYNPTAKLIVTVSPVPLTTTFSGQDVFVANTLSKATLRVAATTFCANHENAAYFPSYEFITLMNHSKAYADDNIHVRDSAVGYVVERFIGAYLQTDVEFEGNFNEIAYLEANPDIDALVRSGSLSSGYEHWKSCGRAENRPLAPAKKTDFMTLVGI